MVQRAIKRFIDVEIRKDAPRTSVAGFGIAMVITDSTLLSTTRRLRRFTTDEEVGDFFGTSSEEYLAANAFLFQDPFLEEQPEEINFGRYADSATAALLECGNDPLTVIATWTAVSDGEFQVTIDAGIVNITACDFSSVTSLDDVAAVIDAKLAANGDCYYLGGRFNIESGTTGAASTITVLDTVAAPAGTDISGSGFLDGDVAYSIVEPGGSYLSQGQVAEAFSAAITAIENVNNDWFAMGAIAGYRDTSDAKDMADEIESRRKQFLITTNDANTLVLGDTSTFAYYVKNANYKRTGFIYHDNPALYPEMSWMGQQIPKELGSTNWSYKTLAGIAEGASVNIDAVILTEGQKNAALDVNCNLYTEILAADATYFGTQGGGKNAEKDGEYIDIIRNIDFIQARLEEQLFSLLLEKDIIPMTNAGISTTDNRVISTLDAYGTKQGIFVEGTVITSFPKRSEISTTDRNDRLLPDGTFTAELQGGINKIILRGTVYV